MSSDDSKKISLDYLSSKFKQLKNEYNNFRRQDSSSRLNFIKTLNSKSSGDSDKSESIWSERCSTQRNVTPDSFGTDTELKYNPAPNYVCPEIKKRKPSFKRFFQNKHHKTERNFNADFKYLTIQTPKIMNFSDNALLTGRDSIEEIRDKKVKFSNHIQVVQLENILSYDENIVLRKDKKVYSSISTDSSISNTKILGSQYDLESNKNPMNCSKKLEKNKSKSDDQKIVSLFKRSLNKSENLINPWESSIFIDPVKHNMLNSQVNIPGKVINKGLSSSRDGREILMTIQNSTSNYLIKINIKEIINWPWKLSLIGADCSKATIDPKVSREFDSNESKTAKHDSKRWNSKNLFIGKSKENKKNNTIAESPIMKQSKSHIDPKTMKETPKGANKPGRAKTQDIILKDKVLILEKRMKTIITQLLSEVTKRNVKQIFIELTEHASKIRKSIPKNGKESKKSFNTPKRKVKVKSCELTTTPMQSKSSKLVDTEGKKRTDVKSTTKSKSTTKKKSYRKKKSKAANKDPDQICGDKADSEMDTNDSLFGFDTDSLFPKEAF